MSPKKTKSEKNQPKISFFTTSEKENPWSEDEMDTGTTTEANEPIEVDDYNRDQSMKNTGVSDDYTTGLLFRLITFAG
jgi:hypothetical protein